jgi:hypothetical protein
VLQEGDQVAGLLAATGRLGQPLLVLFAPLVAKASNRDWSRGACSSSSSSRCSSAFGGTRERDRLDVLGLGADGRLVVAELKRNQAPDTVEMQAIEYAAMASRFTEDTLVEQHAHFLSRDGTLVDQDTARQRLLEHASDLDPEQSRRPRIVLVAGSFPPVVTATMAWLQED